jgi:hypothetical protein
VNRGRVKCSFGGMLAGAVGLLAFASAATADHHLALISEVHHQSDISTSGDWVELKFYADGQNLLGTHYLHLYDAAGVNTGSVALSTVPNGESQRTALIGSGSVPGADVNDGGARVFYAGTACYDEGASLTSSLDCVVWGPSTVAGGSSPATPAGPALGDDQTLQRTLARGCPTALDAADDTDSTAADFALAPGSPSNNAAAPSGVPCTTPSTPAAPSGKKKKKCRKGFKLKKVKRKKKCVRKKKHKKRKHGA